MWGGLGWMTWWSARVEAASFDLAKSSDLIVNAGSTYYVSVASFGASSATMCYQDYSNSYYGTCNALTLSGNALSKGSDLTGWRPAFWR